MSLTDDLKEIMKPVTFRCQCGAKIGPLDLLCMRCDQLAADYEKNVREEHADCKWDDREEMARMFPKSEFE